MDIVVNDYLTWERAEQADLASAPVSCAVHFPEWWKNLRGDLREYLPASGDHRNHTARLCLGLRGASQLGWTIPLDAVLHTGITQGTWRYGHLLQEMLHGTPWAQKVAGEYVWDRPMILAWPWRAKMAPGWRLLMNDYPLDWHQDFHCFTGYVDANHGSGFWGWSQEMHKEFNYYNVETVVIMKKQARINTGSAVFSMIPVYEPTYVPKTFTGYPF
jgi:hypothetical protein